ncbi:uncharacterized protein LOC143036515 isoform X2 [Oratosquilla oratoria]|uniref:uncharacterized protein LOC143036515 isoform X2 n=1 Tax=Oratosquilla oratoria TaxID=337810 RepID=UPI003F7712CC
MAEPQEDEEQWLYGDDKDESKEEGEINDKNEEGNKDKSKTGETPMDQDESGADKDGDVTQESNDKGDGEEGDKEKSKKDDEEKDGDKDGDETSSDEDDVTITIGDIKKQTDIIQQTHQSRFQPKAPVTSGLKDDDFNGPGKVNGVHIADFNIAELEEKPWRKPGADISDYFNYGFNEETWFKYCERQKRMRVHESGAGLAGLGISVTKPFGNTASNIPVAIVNDNSKYNAGLPTVGSRAKAGPPPRSKAPGAIDVIGGNQSKGNTIQVMTADRREYSNKTIMNPSPGPPGYDDMDFGGNPYGETYYPPENNSYYNPYESPGGQWSGGPPPPPPPVGGGNSGGPPNWESNAPVVPVSSAYYEEDSMGAPPSVEQEEERHSRPRRSHRSRSRSPSRRHHRRHSRSRSRSPSHRHKRKKSKRERDAD